jgi:hypothetical protein
MEAGGQRMSKLQHTPGPWKACERGDYSDFDKQSQIIIGDEMRICAVHSYDIEGEANARLIAAAPDMLEALISVYQIYIDRDICCDNEFIKSVIEKATGMSIEEILK